MTEAMLYVLAGLALLQMGVLVWLAVRKTDGVSSAELEKRTGAIEALVRDESERSRREQSTAASDLRGEVVKAVTLMGNELGTTVGRLGDRLDASIRSGADSQAKANAEFRDTLGASLKSSAEKVDGLRSAVEAQLGQFRDLAESHRQQLTGTVDTFRNEVAAKLTAFGEQQVTRFNSADAKDAEKGAALRTELVGLSTQLAEGLKADLAQRWEGFGQALKTLGEGQSQAFEQLRTTVETNLKGIREDNERRLEDMRRTVDEKLQSTLDQRLGASFETVSKHLADVQKGLGEMQKLAADVGGLQKVMSGVKSRGEWGEVILGNLLEQTLAPDQYEANVATTGTAERVEYAVKVPQRDRDGHVWLPIDAKFPKEDYERIMAAQEAGDVDATETARSALDARIKVFGRDICSKYIEPGKTTDWGVMFLPSEGLYAEVLRRTELVQYLHRECKVMLAGPTTLWAVLNAYLAIQRGHAIQKRANEVATLLTAVNGEFGKFGEAVSHIQKKLQEASNSASKLQTRSNQLGKALRKVEKIEAEAPDGTLAQSLDRLELEDDTVGTPESN